MSSRQRWRGMVAVLAAACLLIAGCGGGTPPTVVAVTLNTTVATLVINQTFTFTATVTGATDTTVTWSMTYTTTSNSTATACTPTVCGTIDANGFYQTPALIPNPVPNITVIATSNADKTKTGTAMIILLSGIVVTLTPVSATVGTGETFQYTANITHDTTSAGATWLVTQDATPTATSTSCAPTCGSVDANGNYTAPATVPTSPSVAVEAVAKADTNRFGIATAKVVVAATPTFTGISPTAVPLGAQQADVYLIASNLRSTLPIFFNNTLITNSTNAQLMFVGPNDARIRISQGALVNPPAGGYPITIEDSMGNVVGTFNLTTYTAKPSLVHSYPDSTLQTANSVPSLLTLDGGYFGITNAPAVTGLFNGGLVSSFSSVAPRQISMNTNSGALGTPGLYQITLQSTDQVSAPGIAATNIAVQPAPAVNPPSLQGMVSNVGTSPGAIAVDTTTGIAIVTNQGSSSIAGTAQRITVNGGSSALLGGAITLPDGPVPSGGGAAPHASPVSVSVDEVRHVAAVANSTGQSVSIVDLQAGTLLAPKIDVSGVTTFLPSAVALEPTSGLGLVVFSGTNVVTPANVGAIFNYDPAATPTCLVGTAPYCVTGVVTLTTGLGPRVTFEQRSRFGIVTPGGSGTMAQVDLGRPMTISTIAAAQTGAVRKSGQVTITTLANTPHNLNPSSPGTVLISGVGDGSFDGAWTVTSVPSSTTFTYVQPTLPAYPDATSGGGQVTFSNPVSTSLPASLVTLGPISINPLTQVAYISDPNALSGYFVNLQNQDVGSFAYSNQQPGVTGVSFQPFSNVAVGVNRFNNLLSLVDPTKPQELTTVGTGGMGSSAVAVDPPTNVALVANSTSNDVSVIGLGLSVGGIKPLQISGFQIVGATCGTADPTRQIALQTTPTSSNPLCLKVFGGGLTGSPQVRLDGVVAGTSTAVSSREVDVTIPASFLAAPRRYALDVVNGGVFSNVADFTVVGVIDMTVACSPTNPVPSGVAIDDLRNLAVVSNAGCNNISVLDLNDLTNVTATTYSVGTAPRGVDVLPRAGLAAIANSNTVVDPSNPNYGNSLGAGTITIFDLVAKAIVSSTTVGTRPLGIAFDQDTGNVLVAINGSNGLVYLDLTTPATPVVSTVATGPGPISVAVDPDRQLALVGTLSTSLASLTGSLDILSLASGVPVAAGGALASPTIPTGMVYDPTSASGNFYVVSSLNSQVVVAAPSVNTAVNLPLGINPTSVALSPNTGTMVTVNSQSNTLSIIDTQTFKVLITVQLGKPPSALAAGSSNPQFGVAIHQRLNLAVIVDQYDLAPGIVPPPGSTATGRVLLYPLP